MQTNHPVLDCDSMHKGLLVIKEVSVWDPQLVGHSVIQGEVERNLRVGQTFVSPCLLEVHGQGVVLDKQKHNT